VRAKALIERSLAFGRFLDHVNTSTRGVHLVAPKYIGGAGGQTEAAMHTIIDVLLLRRVVRIEAGGPLFLLVNDMRHEGSNIADKAAGIQNPIRVKAPLDLAHQRQRT
jgi:hypothetical protein